MTERPPELPSALTPSLQTIVVWCVIGLSAFMLLGGTIDGLHLPFGIWFSELVIFGGISLVGWRVLGLDSFRALGLRGLNARALGLGFAFGVVNAFAWALPIMAVASNLFPKELVDRFDSSQLFERHSGVELAIILAGVSIAAPVGEELMFRGVMQRGLSAHLGAPRAIVWSAVIFSAFHLDPVGLVARFQLGVLFGVLFWKSGSLWPAIGAHAANNVTSSVLFLAGQDTPERELVWWVPVSAFVVGNGLLVALVQLTRARLVVDAPASFETDLRPAAPMIRLWSWVSVVAITALVALDWRGVALNVIDLSPTTSKTLKQTDEAKVMRAAARRGDQELEAYRALVTQPQPERSR